MKSLATVFSSALLLAVSCTTVPVTGRKSLNLVGEGTVNQLGAQTYQQEVSKAKVSTDQNATAMVQRVAQRIAQAAEANFHPNYQWEAKLLDDPKTVNAWCLPGGKMAVYSGILPLTQDETGLAVVLGHETAHALAHHGAERMSRSELLQVGEAGILAAVGAAKPGAVQAVGAALGIGSQVGVELPFSRQQESEADHIGLVLMAKAGYDPAKAVDFWQRMAAYGKGKQPPAFLSDHPSDEDRIAAIKKELPEAKAAYVAHQ
ncbi:MAG: M48 family metallopeptidase [Myxococcales bacterium]